MQNTASPPSYFKDFKTKGLECLTLELKCKDNFIKSNQIHKEVFM